jgi:hypothetical protein
VRVGMEATGYSRWSERLLAELGFEVWIGDAAEISRQRVRKQKTDREDARLLLKLLLENRFPRIWVPSPERLGESSLIIISLWLSRARQHWTVPCEIHSFAHTPASTPRQSRESVPRVVDPRYEDNKRTGRSVA